MRYLLKLIITSFSLSMAGHPWFLALVFYKQALKALIFHSISKTLMFLFFPLAFLSCFLAHYMPLWRKSEFLFSLCLAHHTATQQGSESLSYKAYLGKYSMHEGIFLKKRLDHFHRIRSKDSIRYGLNVNFRNNIL